MAFDTVPGGNWTVTHLTHDDSSIIKGKLVIVSLEKRHLSDVTDSWHLFKIDLESLGLPVPDAPMTNDLYFVGHPWADTFPSLQGVRVPMMLAL